MFLFDFILYINYPDLSNTAKCDQTPIQCATVGGHTDVVKLLLKKGARIDRDLGSLPMAVTLDRRDIFKVLLKAGASTGIFSFVKYYLFFYLFIFFFSSAVSCLFIHIFFKATQDEHGRTPLHLAAYMNRTDILVSVSS